MIKKDSYPNEESQELETNKFQDNKVTNGKFFLGSFDHFVKQHLFYHIYFFYLPPKYTSFDVGVGESIAYCSFRTNVIDMFNLNTSQQYPSFTGVSLAKGPSNNDNIPFIVA